MDIEREKDLAWAAGYLAAQGSFTQASNSVKLQVRTTAMRSEAIKRFGSIVGVRVVEGNHSGKDVFVIQTTGNPLHAMMTLLWPYLDKGRKLEYAAERKKLKARLFEAGKANGDIRID